MKHMTKYLLIVIVIILSITASAQDTLNIKKSNNRVYLSGKAFYIHIVKRGETLYRIAMAYNVSVEEIEKENFNIQAEGLSIGQPVKIPVDAIQKISVLPKPKDQPKIHIADSGETAYSIAQKYNLALRELYDLNPAIKEVVYVGQKIFLPTQFDTTSTKILTDKNYIYHVVKTGETFYSIAVIYGFKERQLKKFNENIDVENLVPGQIIKVPLEDIEVITTEPETTNEKYIYYNVKPQETLFSIVNQFKISETLIKSHNPELKQRELLAGEYIKLPKELITIPEKMVDETADKVSVTELLISDTCECIAQEIDKLQVALLLPLYSYTNDTINQNSTRPSIYSRSKIFVDYYEGTLLALHALSEKGLDIDLYVFDTENDTNRVREIVNKEIFPYFDIIFGPIYGQNLPIVAKKAKEYSIPMVSPLSTEQSFLDEYALAFQISPHDSILNGESISYIQKLKADNFIIINDGNRPSQSFSTLFKKTFFKGKKLDDIEHLGYAEITYYADDADLKLDSFIDSARNVVIIPSDNKAFASDVIARLNTLSKKYDITLFGHPRWMNYDNVDIRFFHNLNTHVFSLSYIDYKDESVKNFVYDYRKFYNKEPEKYAFYGYDITYFFLHAYQLYGKAFYCCFENYYPQLLQMNFEFNQIQPNKGFINNHMELLNFQKNSLLTPVNRDKN